MKVGGGVAVGSAAVVISGLGVGVPRGIVQAVMMTIITKRRICFFMALTFHFYWILAGGLDDFDHGLFRTILKRLDFSLEHDECGRGLRGGVLAAQSRLKEKLLKILNLESWIANELRDENLLVRVYSGMVCSHR